ncbi:phenylacetate--CoA ligase family protein [Staphylococcus simulans]
MLEFIYDHSPIWFQNIMVSVKGKQFIKQRYTEEYYIELEKLRNTEDKFALQQERLNDFYKYVKENSEYFKHVLPKIDREITVEDLKYFPIMDKDTIKNNINGMVTRNDKLIPMKTGGSTGVGLLFYSHPIDMSRKIAYLDFFKEQHGVFKGMRRVSIGGKVIVPSKQKRKIFWRYNKPLKQLLLSAYHADGENLKYYVKKLNEFKPQTLDGFTTVLHRIAQYINNHDIRLTFKPIAIFPTAEALTDEMKSDIEKAFDCPVRNQYASSEGAPFITENTKGELEINPETGVFELEHVEGNIYELVVTSFYTTTTPLIRYKIGDSIELFEPLNANYNQSDIKVKRIIGRNNDFLLSNERGIVTNINLSTVVREVGNNVLQSQFIQNKIDEVIVNLVVNPKTDKNKLEETFIKNLEVRFGYNTRFTFNYMNEIPKTSSGKTRFTINNLEK